MVEPAGLQLLHAHVGEVQLQIVQFGNQVAVAAEHLIPAVGAVLARAQVVGHDAARSTRLQPARSCVPDW